MTLQDLDEFIRKTNERGVRVNTIRAHPASFPNWKSIETQYGRVKIILDKSCPPESLYLFSDDDMVWIR